MKNQKAMDWETEARKARATGLFRKGWEHGFHGQPASDEDEHYRVGHTHGLRQREVLDGKRASLLD